MKNKLAAIAVILFATLALADGNVTSNTPNSTPVAVISQQAATTCVESNVAAGSGISLTIPALSGLYFYITNVNIQLTAIAAPVATLVAITSTGTPATMSYRFGIQAAVGTFAQVETFAIPLKGPATGTAMVFTGATLANLSQNMRVCGFYAL